MSPTTAPVVVTALALALTGGAALPRAVPAASKPLVARAATAERTYDGYSKGVRLAELRVGDDRTIGVRRRGRDLGEWSSWRSFQPGADAEALRLWGSIRDVGRDLERIESSQWARRADVTLPGSGARYVHHRDVEAEVGGRPLRAAYWAERGASVPMDLLLDPNGRLLAAIDLRDDHVVVRRGHEAFTTVADWNGSGVSPATHGLGTGAREAVAMSDGVRLATLVYLPQGEPGGGPWPTILVRTPYGITGGINRYWHYVVRGYAVVLQAARGTSYGDPQNRSEGSWEPLVNEPADGAATLEWIAGQPWSDGQICMQGGSYLGYTQWTATMAGNPALRCIVPESSMGTAFSDQPYMGGGFVEGFAYYALWMLDKRILPGRTWSAILDHRPLIEIDEYATGQDVPEWNQMLNSWRNDDTWRGQDWYRDPGPREFASLQISGWFDDDFPGTRANWELMQQRGVGPQRLIVGPWKHNYNTDRRLNGFDFGDDAVRPDLWLIKQRWYDHVLRGLDNGVESPGVEYFVLGVNEWRTASRWPPERARSQPWYLRGDGSSAGSMEGGALSAEAPPSTEPFEEYRYDPASPPRNWYDFDQMERWEDMQSFPFDAAALEARPDVAVFTSPPQTADLTIAGDVLVELYASTDVADTDWWAHLSDVHPDGTSVRLTVGMLRARFRNLDDPEQRIRGSNFEHEELLSGDLDDIVHYRIAIPSIANTFRAGHQVRVAVFNALDNYAFPNSNTGEDESTVTGTVVGTMRIHHGPGRASFVTLPVVGRSPD